MCLYAGEPLVKLSTTTPLVTSEIQPSSTTPNNVGPTSPNRVLPGEPVVHKNYWIPALEIPTFQFALNQFDRWVYGSKEFGSTWASGWDHVLHGPWVVDQDAFTVNQIGHPYQGAMYYGFARSSGLNFWEGWIYSNVGSFVWETYGELTDPSINDQVASGTGGALIGEPLYRMANLVLEGDGGKPGIWRELGAAFISPPTGLNRWMFGDVYSPILKSRRPATFFRLQAAGGVNNIVKDEESSSNIGHHVGIAAFSMDYGLPGQSGYLYLRPFDYFNFELNSLADRKSTVHNIMTRGLLFGKKYESRDNNARGVWGLYGSYDYLSPQVFRLSTTAASLGTTAQWWLSRKVALQGTGLGGFGYGAAGTVAPQGDEKDYHYGAAPQALLALRLILGQRAMFDMTARGYYISGVGAGKAHGTETISRVNTSFVVRLYGHHGLGVNYLISTRDAKYGSASLRGRHQKVGTISLVYNYLSDFHFGVVDWGRNTEEAK
ncbi:MAG: hypothetical protein A2992_08980 [Elusimicrobia bacterium RIFCSPLOWO2_01_FULL_59_12]|nr:MAG: hypothetical protein A2992_08980 [Elusimicrobia bacterium RIFCSPLOWO2_01_FULL_59_12]